MNVSAYISSLVQYGLDCGLIEPCDGNFIINQLMQALCLDSFEPSAPVSLSLEEILKGLLDAAVERGICGEDITSRDLLDTKLMGILTPPPREVRKKFAEAYRESPETATDWYYHFSQDTDYIRRYRIQKDMRWKTDTEYGKLDITINLSKPEKDPKAIAAAKNAPQSGYPKCLLCVENEGYAGRMNHPARQNHRIIPLEIAGQNWFFQYSPYVYYNEHCIAFNAAHTPMKIDRSAFEKLLDFVTVFPHYFIGSNADLPIVGGSILSHEHFQGGRYCFPMEQAPVEQEITFRGYEDVKAGLVKWPMSVIRLDCPNKERLVELADKILKAWRGYSDAEAFVFAETEGEPHNTITPIARRRGADYELDLVLRNNITTEEHPLGVYHPHAQLHHIKKENIGLIEVMGLAVLPSRLKGELAALEEAILTGADIGADPV
ncbi:MAG: UDP-glucose--hexose-1-phosphate uridylyltransferase, partial [Candidatus Faecousia sp.]|nr:UDP-glucose--hexose-1-phosphate uridylyltransferase [Candidatus Faecousia sp.]